MPFAVCYHEFLKLSRRRLPVGDGGRKEDDGKVDALEQMLDMSNHRTKMIPDQKRNGSTKMDHRFQPP